MSKKGTEGRRILALAEKTVYLIFTPGPSWTPEIPQQKKGSLSKKIGALSTDAGNHFLRHSVPLIPRVQIPL